jgi:hypothetical protein
LDTGVFAWQIKLQLTGTAIVKQWVETAAHGSAEQLNLLGVPIRSRAFVFGDDMSMIVRTTKLQSPLARQHIAPLHHWVCATFAAGMVLLTHVVISAKQHGRSDVQESLGKKVNESYSHLEGSD